MSVRDEMNHFLCPNRRGGTRTVMCMVEESLDIEVVPVYQERQENR